MFVHSSLQHGDAKLTIEKIWASKVKKRVAVAKNTFQNWNAMASKFAHVAAGGQYAI